MALSAVAVAAAASRRHPIKHRLFDLLGAQFERRHILAQRRDVVVRRIRHAP